MNTSSLMPKENHVFVHYNNTIILYITHTKKPGLPKSKVKFCTFVKFIMFMHRKYSRNIIVII
jgi:hypothetical protein